MILALEVLFILAVIADTILTYKIIDSGKGTEIGPVARAYIESYYATFFVTVIAVAALIALLRFTHQGWLLVPVNLYMARLCWKNWKVLNG